MGAKRQHRCVVRSNIYTDDGPMAICGEHFKAETFPLTLHAYKKVKTIYKCTCSHAACFRFAHMGARAVSNDFFFVAHPSILLTRYIFLQMEKNWHQSPASVFIIDRAKEGECNSENATTRGQKKANQRRVQHKERQLCNQHGHKKVPDLSIVSVMRPHRWATATAGEVDQNTRSSWHSLVIVNIKDKSSRGHALSLSWVENSSTNPPRTTRPRSCEDDRGQLDVQIQKIWFTCSD